MKRILSIAVVGAMLVAWRYAPAQVEHEPSRRAADASSLVGAWRLDLRPAPDAAPYFREFVVTSVDGDSLQGTFYGAPIERGRINTAWGRVEFAFVTSDLSGPYNHSGRLETDLRSGDRLEGSTYSLGRQFVLPWHAARAESVAPSSGPENR